MKSLLASCLVVLSLLNFTAVAQPDQNREQIIAEAKVALDEFMRTFNNRDAEAWAGTLNYPHVRFAAGQVTIWNSAEEFAANPPFTRLAATGWDHSHWVSREAIFVLEDKVHFNTVFQRFNSGNEVIGTYESLYIVTRVDGKWGTQARSSAAP